MKHLSFRIKLKTLVLVAMAHIACLGTGKLNTERTENLNDLLPARFIHELGPSTIEKLLASPETVNATTGYPGLPVNEMLYLMDKISVDKMITLVQNVGPERVLALSYSMKHLACNKLGLGLDIPNTSWYSACNPDMTNYLAPMAELINGAKDVNQLVQMVNRCRTSGPACPNKNNIALTPLTDDDKRYLEKMSYLVVYLGDTSKLIALVNGVIDSRDAVYLIDQFDPADHDSNGGTPDWLPADQQADPDVNSTFEGQEKTFMPETDRMVRLMQNITDATKLYQMINGLRTAAGTAEDPQQAAFIYNRLLPVLRGFYTGTPTATAAINNGAGYNIGDTVLEIDTIANRRDVSLGDSITINGDSYTIIARAAGDPVLWNDPPTYSSAQIRISPALVQAAADNVSVTILKDDVYLRKLYTMVNNISNIANMVSLLRANSDAPTLPAADPMAAYVNRVIDVVNGIGAPSQPMISCATVPSNSETSVLTMAYLMDNISSVTNLIDLINGITNIHNLSLLTNQVAKGSYQDDAASCDYTAAGQKMLGVIEQVTDIDNVIFVIENVSNISQMAALINALKISSTPKVATLINEVDSDSNAATNCQGNGGAWNAAAGVFTANAGRGYVSRNECTVAAYSGDYTACGNNGGTWTAGDMCKMVNMIDSTSDLAQMAALLDNVTDSSKLSSLIIATSNSSNLVGLLNAAIGAPTNVIPEMANLLNALGGPNQGGPIDVRTNPRTDANQIPIMARLVSQLAPATETAYSPTGGATPSTEHDLIALLMQPYNSATVSNPNTGVGYGIMRDLIYSLYTVSYYTIEKDPNDTVYPNGFVVDYKPNNDPNVIIPFIPNFTPVDRVASLMTGLNATFNYNLTPSCGGADTTISKREALIRMMRPENNQFFYCTKNQWYPGLGPSHIADIAANATATSITDLKSVLNSATTNIGEVMPLTGCADKAGDVDGDMVHETSISLPTGLLVTQPDFEAACKRDEPSPGILW